MKVKKKKKKKIFIQFGNLQPVPSTRATTFSLGQFNALSNWTTSNPGQSCKVAYSKQAMVYMASHYKCLDLSRSCFHCRAIQVQRLKWYVRNNIFAKLSVPPVFKTFFEQNLIPQFFEVTKILGLKNFQKPYKTTLTNWIKFGFWLLKQQ